MKKEEVERLILGMDENPTEAWELAQKKWTGGALVMPSDEVARRKAYKEMLRKIFTQNNITPESFPDDQWLSGKIRRIMI